MKSGKSASIMDSFEALEDPRIDRCKRHQLLDIIVIAICATICGADSWVHMEMFGKSKEEWLKTFLELPHGIPSHDTFGDVFSRLEPAQFQDCFIAWTQTMAQLLPGKWWRLTARRYAVPRTGRQAGDSPGQRLGLGQHPDFGPGEDGREVQ